MSRCSAHGRILKLDTPRNLIAGLGADHMIDFQVRSEGDESLPDDYGADLPGVSAARRDAEHHCLSVAEPHVVIPALSRSYRRMVMNLLR
ncbi:MAG: hypothetical protein R3B91_23350 [Planctomycetaceae bacterium]